MASGDGNELGLARPRPTLAMRRSLAGSVVLFGAVVTTQVVVHLAALVLMALVAGAAEILLHTGGLDSETFATSLYTGLASVIALTVGLQARAFVRGRRMSGTDSVKGTSQVTVAAIGLLLALAAVTLLGWHHSAFFPYPLATIVVIANVAFFAITGPAWLGRVAFRWTRRLFEIGARSQYVAGATTAALILLSAAGLWSASVERRGIAAEAADVEASGRFDRLAAPTSFSNATEEGLCLIGDALQPELASRSVGCGFTARPGGAAGWGADGGRPSDDCATSLHDGPFRRVQAKIAFEYRLSDYDANEVTMRALLITCAQETPPRDLGAFFWKVAKNEAARFFRGAAQLASCDELSEVPDICTAWDSEETAAAKADELWPHLECALGAQVMLVLRMYVVDDLSFVEIGDRLHVSATRARDTYYNAIKKIRREGLADCFRER